MLLRYVFAHYEDEVWESYSNAYGSITTLADPALWSIGLSLMQDVSRPIRYDGTYVTVIRDRDTISYRFAQSLPFDIRMVPFYPDGPYGDNATRILIDLHDVQTISLPLDSE